MDDWLRAAARERADRPALVVGSRAVSYAELDTAASRAARRLAAAGLGRGDRVPTARPPGVDFVELFHGAPRLGAALAPIDPRLGAAVKEPCAGREADVELREDLDPRAVHSVVLTSGTTGEPRPVGLTVANHGASASAVAELFELRPEDRWLCALPLFHVGGLAVLIRCALRGATAILHERFEADRVKHSLESGEASVVSLVPTMLSRLREAGLRSAPSLRVALLGGGPIPAGLLEWSAEAEIPAVPSYGLTETASLVAVGSPGESGARPLPGVELAIGDDEEILVRGPMVAPGAVAPDGWLHTGDRGVLEDGRLHVQGRLKNLIVTGGENVAPEEVETALAEHPAVADAAVIGVPDPDWGEAVTAFVVLRDGAGAGAEDLTDHCRARLAPFKVPKRIEQVPGLPRGATGKLLREELLPP